jgi:hypothetical protein
MSREQEKKGPASFHILHTPARKGDDSLNVEEQTGDKSCLATIDTRASVTIVRQDITAGLPEREQTWPYVLQMESGKTFPVLKEAIVEQTMGQCH